MRRHRAVGAAAARVGKNRRRRRGAVPLAAAMDSSFGLAGKKVVLCLSGGNIDVTLISRVIDAAWRPTADSAAWSSASAIGQARSPSSLPSSRQQRKCKEVDHDRYFRAGGCRIRARDLSSRNARRSAHSRGRGAGESRNSNRGMGVSPMIVFAAHGRDAHATYVTPPDSPHVP